MNFVLCRKKRIALEYPGQLYIANVFVLKVVNRIVCGRGAALLPRLLSGFFRFNIQ